ncbi:hypothetical protein Bca101_088384 [Brassica carinata]
MSSMPSNISILVRLTLDAMNNKETWLCTWQPTVATLSLETLRSLSPSLPFTRNNVGETLLHDGISFFETPMF